MSHQDSMTTLRDLHVQIEDICRRFRKVRSEAAVVVHTSQMPDATLQLNDVLKATEEATMTILDSANALSAIAQAAEIPEARRKEISDHVGKIYEACSFQDISGQRIRKVQGQLGELEGQLSSMSEMTRGYEPKTPKQPRDALLNGPQLSSVAPSQAEIDDLFSRPE